MKTISLSVRCTREEYMAFCVSRHKKSMLPPILSGVLLLAALAIFSLAPSLSDLGSLFWVFGMVGIFINPVILPMMRKGAAAKHYDKSDFLRQAMVLTLTEDTVTVRSACHEGTIPLSLMTAVQQTDIMTALVFGNELTLCIPRRAMDENDYQTLCDRLTDCKKGLTV